VAGCEKLLVFWLNFSGKSQMMTFAHILVGAPVAPCLQGRRSGTQGQRGGRCLML
jgi:hypothetical protein